MRRARLIAPLLLTLSLALIGGGPARPAAAAGTWLPAGPLIVNRTDHAAARLHNGQVLIVGGSRGGSRGGETLGHAERYDPATGRWSFSEYMRYARIHHTATTLADGRVLVIGGEARLDVDGPPPPGANAPGNAATAEVYHPATNSWSLAAPLGTPRVGHTATLLGDGRVLVVGGVPPASAGGTASPLATAELYDPRANTWSPAAPPAVGHAYHTAARLAGGEIVVIGGRGGPYANSPSQPEVERYDPAANSWRAARSLPVAGTLYAAALLADGRVLVAGSDRAPVVALYDPSADSWTRGSAPPFPMGLSTATPLPDGEVLITGGRDYAAPGEQGLAALYNPATDRWAALPNMRVFRSGQSATALGDGRVLIAGGGLDPIAELYIHDGASEQCFPETGKCLRGRFLAYWLAHGGLAINGYPLTGEITERLEDGKEYTVQYLERVRLEYHPENGDPRYQVLLGQFGRQIHPADPPVAALPGAHYFPQTGHNLGGTPLGDNFRDYWEQHGGLDQFGYPLSEIITETLEDGKPHRVQYFERARFESHPNKPPYDILLGQFGRRIMTERGIAP